MILNILYIIISLVFAVLIAGWFYVLERKKNQKIPIVLFLLRTLTIFSLLLLLFNPKWIFDKSVIVKPELIVAIDNSKSIKRNAPQVEKVTDKIRKNKDLNLKFNVKYLTFGEKVSLLDSLQFNENDSDISQLLSSVKSNNTIQNTPILLITDGNQTKGSDFSFYSGKNKVFPIVVGDTTSYEDISIQELNVNQYAFLENEFPVEVFVKYQGKKEVNAKLTIKNHQQIVYQTPISFNRNKTSEKISFLLKANSVGTQFFNAVITGIPDEKNLQNNRRDFTVDVVDQQSKILIYSSFLHPDIGAIKESIESNKQRKVDLSIGRSNDIKLSDYQSIIIYQPTSYMSAFLKDILQQNKNLLLITGTKTDWSFLNQTQTFFHKKFTTLNEKYQGVYNPNYPNFTIEDFKVEQLPPLQDVFGEIQFKIPFETLFFQKIGNTTLLTPLVATLINENQKMGVVFGEGLWQWKMWSKKENQTFEPFDNFINALIQYTTENNKTSPLKLDYNKIVYSNQTQLVKAQYFDSNFKIDLRVNISLFLTNLQDKKTLKFPMTVTSNEFELALKNLKSGDYSIKAVVEGKNTQVIGNFKVLNYSIEEQFASADYTKLNTLASNTSGKTELIGNADNTIKSLLQDQGYKNIQKSNTKTTPLIDWKWLLAVIILSLTVEWFIRKYRGLI